TQRCTLSRDQPKEHQRWTVLRLCRAEVDPHLEQRRTGTQLVAGFRYQFMDSSLRHLTTDLRQSDGEDHEASTPAAYDQEDDAERKLAAWAQISADPARRALFRMLDRGFNCRFVNSEHQLAAVESFGVTAGCVAFHSS